MATLLGFLVRRGKRFVTCGRGGGLAQELNMKQYTILKAENEVPIPSHFSPNSWIIAAMDNKDWGDFASLSGTEGKHQAVNTFNKVTTQPPVPKLTLTEMGLKIRGHRKRAFYPVR